jgi:DNA-binding NarL/FixJ family response regulator
MSVTSSQDKEKINADKKRTYRHWTTLEDRKLLELRNSGMRFKHIATQLSRTAISVEKRYRKILRGE